MAKVFTKPKLQLTAKEKDLLIDAINLFSEIANEDDCQESLFNECDNCKSDWGWLLTFLDNLLDLTEVNEDA